MKKSIALLLSLIFVLLAFAACSNDDETTPTRVVPTGVDSLVVDTNQNPQININNNWWLNYYAVFTYFCPAANFKTDTVISEKKTANSFIVSNLSEGYFKYYADTEQGLDEYVVVPTDLLFEHRLVPAASVNNVNSMFMKITAVAESFASGENVIYTGSEMIANRNCQLYMQRTFNESGEQDSVAYLWIDAQYGFCSKCITYDANGEIVMSWELNEFRTGDITDAEVKPDLSSYNFVEAE